MSDENIVDDQEKSEADKAKSEGAKRRWDLEKDKNNRLGFDRNEEKYNFKFFKELKLSKEQKRFVVTFMDPPYLGKKEFRFEAYKKVYNSSNQNSMRSNCYALLNKPKIKEAMRLYQVHALKNHKTEVTSESIEMYRKRATYTMDMFFDKNGSPLSLEKIDPEWMVCIDGIDRKLSTKTEQPIINFKLADRDKAAAVLQRMLGVMEEPSELQVSVPVSEGKNAIDSAGGKEGNAPRIMLNMSVGNIFEKKE